MEAIFDAVLLFQKELDDLKLSVRILESHSTRQ